MTAFDAPVIFLPDILGLHARTHPAKPALVCGDETLDWGGFDARVRQGAAALVAQGVGPGDVVGLLADPSIDAVVAMCAVLRTGAALASLSGMVAADALRAMVADSGAVLLLADDRNAPALAGIGATLPLAALSDPVPVPSDWPTLRPGDDLCIIYSSGTTSTPKGIVLSQQCRLANAQALALEMRYDERAVVLVTTALYSNTAWSLLTTAILVGATTVLLPKFTTAGFCAAVPRWGVTHTTMVPAQLQMIRDEPGQAAAALASIRTMCSVGSVLPQALKRWAMERFPGALFEVYGLTEGLVTLLKPEDLPARIETVGRPMIGHDIRIVDDAGTELPRGEPGEIVGYSPVLMTRYHRSPEATEAAIWRDPAGRTFLRSGDIGAIDREGYVRLIDRKKDMIISGGYNIYPSDLERVLAAHPAVREVCVVGVPHPKWQETPLAVIVPAAAVDSAALLDWARARLGKHQRISAVVQRDSLPRNAGGKVLKRELVRSLAP